MFSCICCLLIRKCCPTHPAAQQRRLPRENWRKSSQCCRSAVMPHIADRSCWTKRWLAMCAEPIGKPCVYWLTFRCNIGDVSMTFRCNVGDVMTKSHQAIFFMQRSPFYAHTSQSVDLLNLATAFEWHNLFKEAQESEKNCESSEEKFETIRVTRSISAHSWDINNSIYMTASQLNPPYECGEGMKVKVVKWCLKMWNWPILMHIYDKQCEIMQKNQWRRSNFQTQCSYKGTAGALCWKR